MVPAERILQTATEVNADIVGVSGLITPSLEEMVHIARELERQNYRIPLLVGGATTSKIHTAVKIEPEYSNPVVHVVDASRAVGVVSNLLSDTKCVDFVSDIKSQYGRIREERESQQRQRALTPIGDARRNRLQTDWNTYTPPQPSFLGTREFIDYPLAELRERIDWTPFFQTWELAGRYPKILDDDVVGESARALFADAQAMLGRIVDEHWLEARGVIGFFPARSNDTDGIDIFAPESDALARDIDLPVPHPVATFQTIRQQFSRSSAKNRAERPNLALADYIAPASSRQRDYVGMFAVTTGIGIEEHVARFEADLDDYSAILLKALADRLAEAFAERMHERVRSEFWGYAPDEHLNIDDLISERYRGIRPAPGYPACPDHSGKRTIWSLLDPEPNCGIVLTENFAMHPGAAVSGLYFSHPEARYFGTGKIGFDQVTDYAARSGLDLETAERWLAPILGYIPADREQVAAGD
jgi:5-methyltetrahydrofolate--homocysteine methyltransferase